MQDWLTCFDFTHLGNHSKIKTHQRKTKRERERENEGEILSLSNFSVIGLLLLLIWFDIFAYFDLCECYFFSHAVAYGDFFYDSNREMYRIKIKKQGGYF